MLLSALLFGALALAAPSTLKPRMLKADDVLAYGADGKVEVFEGPYYKALMANVTKGPSLEHYNKMSIKRSIGPFENLTPTKVSAELEKRGCKSQTVIWDKSINFLQWDVPMSRVIHAVAAQSTVIATEGFSIANGFSIAQALDITFVKDFLKTTTTFTYTETWTSSYTAGYSFPLPAGFWGVVVSNPKTLRHYGEVYKGCVGGMSKSSTYQADSYYSASFDKLAWVVGSITLCQSDSYPVKRCLGEGYIE